MLQLINAITTPGVSPVAGTFRRNLRQHAPNIIGVLLGIYAIAFTYLSTSQVTHERRLREVEGLLTIGLLDAESGQRAYLLTSDPVFLDQYQAGLKALRIYSPVYERILIDEESKRLCTDISTLLELKKAEMASTITAHDQNRRPAAISIVSNHVGHQYTEQIYSDLRKIRKIESERVAPFQFWQPPKEVDIHDPDRMMSRSALLRRLQSALP